MALNAKKKRNDTIDPAKTFADLMKMYVMYVGPVPVYTTQDGELIGALAEAGCVLDTYKVRDEVRKDVYVDGGSTSWPSSDEDLWNAPPSEQKIKSFIVTPAVYATKIPPHVAVFGRLTTYTILWMLRSFDATTIDSMYRLDDRFHTTMLKLYSEAHDAEPG